ncbi:MULTISPECIES: glycosyltransferase [Nocardioides]|uniref:Glycosyltransferase n=1 Tax=Nocardioides vastitatis TaxID=2568655 RepID=A0ABW0ZPP9_9ACTN|nr:glycosyltransferase [Nocardioides sp.]THI98366.1 glycosyltransferase family 1 protein [Nocardioides sp.]
MRVLACSTTGAGHFTPMKPWLRAFAAAGHDVLVLGPPALEESVREWAFAPGAEADPAVVGPLWGRVYQLAPAEAKQMVEGEIFTRHNAGAMLDPVGAVIDDFQPDLVLRDPMEWASAVCAGRAGVPQVRIAISLAAEDAQLLSMASPILEDWEPGTTELVAASPFLTRFPASLDPPIYPATARYRFAEETHRSVAPDFVYATLGTVAPTMNHLLPWYGVLTAALEPLPVRALLTVGKDLDPGIVTPAASNVDVRAWADHAAVLSEAAVIVHHGGSGTTLDALAAGTPQVVVPLFADQNANAVAIDTAGVGFAAGGQPFVMRMPEDGDVELVRATVEQALVTPAIARRAEKVAGEIRALPPLDVALLD